MILGGIASTAWFAQISIFIGARLFAVYADLIVAPTADLMRSSCGGDDFFDVFISTIFVVKTIFTKPYSVAVSVFLIVGYLPTNLLGYFAKVFLGVRVMRINANGVFGFMT